jgi:oligopeptidase B
VLLSIRVAKRFARKNLQTGEEQLILDENELAQNSSYFNVGVFAVSPDETILAYTVDRIGNERFTLYFKNLTRY